MPDTIRITQGSMGVCWWRARRAAHCALTHALFRKTGRHLSATCAITATILGTAASAAKAAAVPQIGTVQAYMEAIAQLDSHEIVALALTLGILCFAVVTAILLVRPRRPFQRAAAIGAAGRHRLVYHRRGAGGHRRPGCAHRRWRSSPRLRPLARG